MFWETADWSRSVMHILAEDFSSVCAYEQFTFEWLGHSLELNNSWSKCHKHVLSSWSLSVLCILRHTTSVSLLGCAPLTSHWNDMHVYFSVMEKFIKYYFRPRRLWLFFHLFVRLIGWYVSRITTKNTVQISIKPGLRIGLCPEQTQLSFLCIFG